MTSTQLAILFQASGGKLITVEKATEDIRMLVKEGLVVIDGGDGLEVTAQGSAFIEKCKSIKV